MFKSIKAKILLLSLGLTFFSILIFLFSVSFDYTKEKLNDYSAELSDLENLFLKDAKTIKDFIIYDLNDPIFSYTRNSIHYEEHKIYLSGAEKKLKLLLNSEKLENDTIKYIYSRYYSLINDIDTLFDLGCKNGIKRKYIKKETYQLAELLKREKILQPSAIVDFYNQETDFQTSKDKVSYIRFKEQLKIINETISDNQEISGKEKTIFLDRLQKYNNDIDALHKMDMLIGVDLNEGLKGKIDNTLLEINSLISKSTERMSEIKERLIFRFRLSFILISILIIILALIISFRFSKRNTYRLSELSDHITKFIKSKYTYRVPLKTNYINDEIGKLIKSYQILQSNLIDHINNLENIVYKRTLKVERQKNFIAKQKEEILAKHDELLIKKQIVEHQNENILYSIYYAKRIQEALLDDLNNLNNYFKSGFIFYQPRDIVSGDFYWIKHINTGKTKLTYFAAADCTGHGVPGAFMSLLGISFLNEILIQNKVISPSRILDALREKFIMNLSNSNGNGKGKGISDGLDIALCVYDHKTGILQFAGANRPLFLVRDNQLLEYRPDIMPIGEYYKEYKPFTNNEINVIPNDKIYIFTDGYTDQFNEENKKKYTRKKLKEMLLGNSSEPIEKQADLIKSEFLKWKGTIQQTDDVLFIGIQLN
ncbi:MAG: hypothetical protein A2X13_09200 [Bacteroidetes bacterium GWC2_33_15]|nr:MAG: hypothetical protein A2X10_01830 [Bacteroidetes bacterium GWA2_33_15]OFX49123.1 MAG: hypothetical protein A2X13_09200 [Bacteroidetes bacterium GWC2_33_15]OFX64891.1 MAG: hypothetical protein A2X15_06075 [Bacteroidetes bacterium GWB2_32_14]OFX68599.1 MAG: hypothetical protein A2X14_14640 [Bacteroidetes bacterium GWD2_33_33]HAN17449.1 hypothetical protein [Bacteroidales bacterium]